MSGGYYRGMALGLSLGLAAAGVWSVTTDLPMRLRPVVPPSSPPVTEAPAVAAPDAAPTAPTAPVVDARVDPAPPDRLEPPSAGEPFGAPRPGESAPRVALPDTPGGQGTPATPGALPSEPDTVTGPARTQADAIALPTEPEPQAAPTPPTPAPDVSTTAPAGLVDPQAPSIPAAPGVEQDAVTGSAPSGISSEDAPDGPLGGDAQRPGALPQADTLPPATPTAPEAPATPGIQLNLDLPATLEDGALRLSMLTPQHLSEPVPSLLQPARAPRNRAWSEPTSLRTPGGDDTLQAPARLSPVTRSVLPVLQQP